MRPLVMISSFTGKETERISVTHSDTRETNGTMQMNSSAAPTDRLGCLPRYFFPSLSLSGECVTHFSLSDQSPHPSGTEDDIPSGSAPSPRVALVSVVAVSVSLSRAALFSRLQPPDLAPGNPDRARTRISRIPRRPLARTTPAGGRSLAASDGASRRHPPGSNGRDAIADGTGMRTRGRTGIRRARTSRRGPDARRGRGPAAHLAAR